MGVEGSLPVDIHADQLEYEASRKLLTGRGHVTVRQGTDVLSGDTISLRTDTQDARAQGHVVFVREGHAWRGEQMTYNFKTRKGDFGEFEANLDPFYIKAKDSEQVSRSEFVLHNATITTCQGDRPQFFIKARRARIFNNTRIRAEGVLFFLGMVPIFYVPFWNRDIGDASSDIDFVPGYNRKMGAFLLTAYNYHFSRNFTASTHVDYRAYRGWGGGEDLLWGSSATTYKGGLETYYTKDKSPFENRTDKDKAALADLVKEERYRLRLADVRTVSDRDYVITEMNYLSDPVMLEDFFSKDYRNNAQPENRVNLIHRGDRYIAGLELNQRLNDFFENVNRMPEATLQVPRMRLGDTPFYYENENSASRLEEAFSEPTDLPNYDAFRIDSRHTVFYPTRHFGFLNVIPRAGYRGTYYSKTSVEHTVTNVISTVDSNGVIGVTNEVSTLTQNLGADIRHMYELGVEVSFKAFSVWTEDWVGRDDQGLRHIVEPYANYTFIPEPNLRPANVPQFDKIDELDKENDILLGIRNKVQTKRRERVHDLIDANVWTYYLVDKEEGENDFTDANFKVRLKLVDWWLMDFDGTYDMYGRQINTFNTQVALIGGDESRLDLEYRYALDRREQIASEINLWPNSRWSCGGFVRYSMFYQTLEETGAFIKHKTSCLGIGLGYDEIYNQDTEDDFQVWIQIWLLAFPKSFIDISM